MAIRYSVKAAPVYRNPNAVAGGPASAYGTAARQPGAPPAAGGAGYGSGLGKAFSGIGQALGAGVTRAGGAINGRPLVRTQATPDPFAALSDDEQQKRAQATIDALINPRLAEIRAEYDRRSAQGSAAIKGITEALAQRLAAFGGSARDIYSQAQQSTAATEAALAGFLSGQGGAQAAGLASQLAGINAPAATGAATAAVQQAGTGAAGASYGKGSAVLEDLISRGASAQEYAAKLPGIGAALGLQQMGKFQGQLTEDEKTALGALTSQVPGLVSSTLSDLRSTELTKAQERERIREYNQSRADKIASAKATAAAKGQKTYTLSPGQAVYDSSGRLIAQGPQKTGAAAKPLVLSPGQVAYFVDGSGKVRQIKGPEKAVAATKPIVVGGQDTGWNIYDPNTGKVLATMSGRTAKPTITGSATTGWTARDASGKTLWTQAGAPAKPLVVGSAQTGWNIVDTSTGTTLATMPGATPKPIVTGSAQTGWTARDASGNTLWTQAGAPPKAPSDAQVKGQLQKLAAAGGYNPTTRALSPAMRQAIQQITGIDPGPVANPKVAKMFEGAGILPKGSTPPTPKPPKPPSVSDKGKIADWNGQAEVFATNAYNGTTVKDPDTGKNVVHPPMSYMEALREAKKTGIPMNVMRKHLRERYAHGNKAVHDFVTDPATTFVIDPQGRVAAFYNGQFVRFMKPGKPGYATAHRRASHEARGGGDFTPAELGSAGAARF